MAAPLYASEQYVKHFFTDESVEVRPTQWEIALHTDDPGVGSANESDGFTYQRQDVEFEAYLSDNGKFYEAQSVGDVVFPAGDSADNYTVTHYTVRDKTSGEALATAQLVVPIPVKSGTVVTFPAGYIKVRGV